ncbi:MAG: BTAD domain-containing putative transcriptional regulator [Pseudothermotoga sp.]
MLKITTFGIFSIYSEDRQLNLSKIKSRKARDLLRYFVVFRHKQIPSDILCEIFWSDMDEKYAKMNLQSTVHMLRAFFGKDIITFQNGNYCFDPLGVVEFDADNFENLIQLSRSIQDNAKKKSVLEEAITLYKGDFMVENLYEDWTVQFREYYRDLYVQALIDLAQILMNENALTEAIEKLRNALNNDSFNETAAPMLMKVYLKKGCPSEAVKVYRRFSEILSKELQIKPSKEMIQLYEAIIKGDLENRWIVVLESKQCHSKKETIIQLLRHVIREKDQVQVLSDGKIGVLIDGVALETAEGIYQRIRAALDGSLDDVKVYLRKAR